MRWLVVMSIAFAGCRDHEAARLDKIRDAVCTCKTSSCAELAMKDIPNDDAKPTRKSQEIARSMMECLSKLYDAERPTTDPDESTSP